MKHLYGLDLLRFCAASLVVVYHLGSFGLNAPLFPADGDARAFGWMAPVAGYGWVGVQIFFVISGFVIAASAQNSTAGSFLLRRAIRVFPALWIMAIIAFSVRLLWGEPAATLIPVFLRSIFLSPVGPYIDGVVWTLVVEAVFYIFIALLIVAQKRLRLHLSIFELGAYLLMFGSAAFLIVSTVTQTLSLTFEGLDLAALTDRYFFSVLLLRHGVFFALGMLVWVGWSTHFTTRITLASLFCIVMSALQMGLHAQDLPAPYVPTLIWLAAVLLVFLSLYRQLRISNPKTGAWISDIGRLTYPLYLGHFTVGMYSLPMLANVIPSPALLLMTELILIFVLSWIVLKGPERWLQSAAKTAIFPRRDAPAE